MIGKSPNTAPSAALSSAWPTGIDVDDQRDEDRRRERDQRRPVRLHLEPAEQHEQRDDRHARRRSSSAPSESPTGSNTCLYMPHLSRCGYSSCATAYPEPRCTTLRPVRAALFITCFNDTLFPGDGPRGGRAAGAPRGRGRLPGGADLLRPDARQLGLRRARARALARRFERVFGGRRGASSRRRRRASAMVREHCPAVADRVFELTEFLVDVLGVEDVGASFPHRVTYHPTCHSLRLLHVGDRPLRLLRAVRGIDLVELERGAGVLRLRRHVRGQERRHVDGDALRQAAPRARHARRGLHRRPTTRA